MNILIVDDSPDIVRLVSQVLELEGHTVHIARDGLEALQKHATIKPDAVVLDVNMPVIEGWEVCQRVKQERPHVPVMMLTVRAEKADREKGRTLGADAYLAKPFDIPEFIATIKTMLETAYPPERFQRTFDPTAQFTNANGSQVWEALGRRASSDTAMSVARISMPAGITQRKRRNKFNEVLIIISGSCTVHMNQITYQLAPDSVLHIPAGTYYREQVEGSEPCIAWAICTPAYAIELVEYAQAAAPAPASPQQKPPAPSEDSTA